ncbi:MAG: class II aldolase/adducin family protein [Wenzhouxiangellaceae bacterium]|nr:class II aldolase/adducin family protein [Wenzhouxiangellaceae bacterium]
MIDEGVIKYDIDWCLTPPRAADVPAPLIEARDRLFRAGLIGYDTVDEVGYGNISLRVGDGRRFVVSGTQTGHLERTGPEHYCRVTGYDIDANRLRCEGPVRASSEALTHAAIYELSADIGAVVHVHSAEMWTRLADRMPTTSADVPYGTPEMAREFGRLYRETDLAETGIAVMGGHADGLISFGKTMEQALQRILAA